MNNRNHYLLTLIHKFDSYSYTTKYFIRLFLNALQVKNKHII